MNLIIQGFQTDGIMKTLHILAGKDTPEIYFGSDINMFHIEGISYPANPIGFYEPVLMWVHDFLHSEELNSKIEFNFKLNYFNTASMKIFVKLFRIIDNSPSKELVSINWFYDEEDPDMFEMGNRLKQFVKTKFNLKAQANAENDEIEFEGL